MKKFRAIITVIIIFIFTGGMVEAQASQNRPIANVYKEGIHHFNDGSGRKISLKLVTPDKKADVMIIDDKEMNLKHYLSFGKNCTSTDMVFESPEDKYTVIIVGDGEIAFTFER